MMRPLVLSAFVAVLAITATHESKAQTGAEAIDYCASAGVVGYSAFAYCVSGVLTVAEIEKCLTGGDCFGKNNEIRKVLESIDDIRKYGVCGGSGSDLRTIGVCPKLCKGAKSWVEIQNWSSTSFTGKKGRLKNDASCGGEQKLFLGPGEVVRYGGLKGENWIDFWAGNLGGVPVQEAIDKARVWVAPNGKTWPYAETVWKTTGDDPWRGPHWRLRSGLAYAIVPDTRLGLSHSTIIITPRYER